MTPTQQLHHAGQSLWLGDLMAADGGNGEHTLADFAAAGVDHHPLAAQLQRDGAASFVTSWHSLLASIASKHERLTADDLANQ